MAPKKPQILCRPDLGPAATPRLLRARPVHRWFWFPHSFSPELVEALMDAWDLRPGSAVLDPFVGAGTTLLAALQRGCRAVGTDLSPLAVLVSGAKARSYCREELDAALENLRERWRCIQQRKTASVALPSVWEASVRMRRAFLPSELAVLAALREGIFGLREEVRDFFLVALLGILPEFSRAVADGGWFRWAERPEQAERIVPRFLARAETMLEELRSVPEPPEGGWEVHLLDARNLSALKPRVFDALITSPPYPNRHDYSRVFQVELLFLGRSEEEITRLRHGSLRSHVEARPPGVDERSAGEGYRMSPVLARLLRRLPPETDRRVRRMLEGYFEDMYLVLRSAREVLRPGAKAALVVGSVRYGGILFPVDRILTVVGRQAGFHHVATWVLRARGNSAQQMGHFGKVLSPETVLILECV